MTIELEDSELARKYKGARHKLQQEIEETQEQGIEVFV